MMGGWSYHFEVGENFVHFDFKHTYRYTNVADYYKQHLYAPDMQD